MKNSKKHRLFLDVVVYLKELTKKPIVVFSLGALLGFIFFVLFYGLKIVNPSFTDWLMSGSDLKQHFVGWEYYRHESWSFPLGVISQLAYPSGISLTYMDSIPLLAIPFKLFSGILPDNFQYFGLWGLICYMLQGGIAAIIMRRWTKNIWIILLVALVFIVSPIFMTRMFVHTALASHWIILLGILVLLEYKRFTRIRTHTLVWSGLLSMAVAIHPYFVPMVGLPFIISIILTHRAWVGTIIKLFIPIVSLTAVFWLIGGFSVGVHDTALGGLGDYGLNLASLYASQEWSLLVPKIPNISFAGESMNYLGLGVLLLLPIVMYIFFTRYDTLRKIQVLTRKVTRKHILIGLSVLTLCILALSPRVRLGQLVLIDIRLPHIIESLWSIFRASARLFWVVYYLIVIGVFAVIIRSLKGSSQTLLVVFLAFFVTIQVIDLELSPQAVSKHKDFSKINAQTYKRKPVLSLEEWGAYVNQREHLVYLDKDMQPNTFFALVDMSLKYHLSMNTGYFARSPADKIEEYQKQQYQLLLEKKAALDSNLYVTNRKDTAKQLREKGYEVKQLDSYFVIAN